MEPWVVFPNPLILGRLGGGLGGPLPFAPPDLDDDDLFELSESIMNKV